MTDPVDAAPDSFADRLARAAPPEGFHQLARASAFTRTSGPFFIGHPNGRLALGFRLDAHHLNFGGSAHGGLIATLADVALSMAAIRASDPPIQTVTVSLSIDFIGGSKPGDWIVCETEVLRAGAGLVFVDGRITANDLPVARVSGVFKKLRGRVVS